ncbi:FAD:protein FMN transferase [Staphylococcus sp. H16/1A]|uniref:FAD:protein FMN transferase n=2 Tax=Staphylococcus canis TaxID=2724942 RepID=A0ABS0T7Y3_9STAP|nr:FAD:protein FMN transferase [Staphylococcus canis]MBI5974867.1 FAD:protein FMN transferase [Staphylococcus canis]
MGTQIQLAIEHPDATSLLQEAESQIKVWEQRFSANRASSELMAVNQHAGQSPVSVHPELFDLIQYAHHVTQSSQQKMNILIGPLVKLWQIGFNATDVPDKASIESRLALIHPDDMVLNAEDHSVFLVKPGMEIDLGAIAKGYFADELQSFFMKHGVKRGMINLGGNVITIGTSPRETDWQVGIRHPFLSIPIASLNIRHQAVVTSGIYERYFIHEGQLYHHILDSRTGYPADNDIASVTIVSDHAIDGEVWSTLCSFGQAQHNIDLLNQIDGIEAVIITKDEDILYTTQLKNKLTWR